LFGNYSKESVVVLCSAILQRRKRWKMILIKKCETNYNREITGNPAVQKV
jgi:hypothetical protein